MAKAPQSRKLQIEDFPNLDRETAEKLFPILNQFIDETASALDGSLTLGDNFKAQFKTIDIQITGGGGGGGGGVSGSGTANHLASWTGTSSLGDGGSGTPGALAAWTGAGVLGNANEESWHLVGGVGEPAFQNGWVNF